MAALFTGSKFSATDANGNPLAAGRVYTYAAGTLTPKATYTTQVGDVANANPVILDSAGRANIWLGSGAYKFVVQDSTGAAAPDGTVDNVTAAGYEVFTDLADTSDVSKGDALLGVKSALTAATARTQHSKNADSVTVEDFANNVTAADGVDFSSYIQAAVNSGAKYVRATQTGGTYFFKDVTVPAGVTVDMTGCTCKLAPFTGSIGAGFHSFFKASSTIGIQIIGGIYNGNAVAQTVDAPNIDRYAGMYFVDCDDLLIRGCRFTSEPYGNASIRIRQGSRVKVLENTVVNKGIHYNAYSGSQYSVTIDNNETTGCGISINDDQAAQHLFGWSISGNRIRASNALDVAGIGARASSGVIRGNTILGGYFGMTISAGGATFQQHDVLVDGNTVAADSGSFNPYGIEHFAYDITITNNILTNCGIVSSSPTGRNIKISGNLVTATLTAAANDVAIGLSAGLFTGVDISHNTVQGLGSFAVLSCVTEALNVSHNTVTLTDYAGASFGIKLQNASAAAKILDGAVITGNIIKNASKSWLWVLGNGANTLTVNDMRAVFNPTLGSTTGILIDTAASLGATSMHAFNETTGATFQNTPTAAPAASGSVWRDAADANRLKMVP